MEKDPHMEDWAEKRGYGLMHFIIMRGFLLFAMPGSLLYGLFTSLRYDIDIWHALARAFSIFTVAGFFFSLLLWFLTERKYKAYLEKKRKSDLPNAL